MACLLGAVLLPTLAACGFEAIGDPPSEPSPSLYGKGARLRDVLGPAKWVDLEDTESERCSGVPSNRRVAVTGVTIGAIDRYDETGGGQTGNFYVQDTSADPKPYSGITVFAPSFSPPDLRLFEGDVADLSGEFLEFLGPASGRFGECKTLPEIGGTMTFRFDGQALTPKTIPLEDLKSYPTARQWLGMLVRVENVSLAQAGKNKGGRYTAPINVGGGISQTDVPFIDNELFDLEQEGPLLEQGTTFKSVTGIVTYFYGFKLAPRSAADFEL